MVPEISENSGDPSATIDKLLGTADAFKNIRHSTLRAELPALASETNLSVPSNPCSTNQNPESQPTVSSHSARSRIPLVFESVPKEICTLSSGPPMHSSENENSRTSSRHATNGAFVAVSASSKTTGGSDSTTGGSASKAGDASRRAMARIIFTRELYQTIGRRRIKNGIGNCRKRELPETGIGNSRNSTAMP